MNFQTLNKDDTEQRDLTLALLREFQLEIALDLEMPFTLHQLWGSPEIALWPEQWPVGDFLRVYPERFGPDPKDETIVLDDVIFDHNHPDWDHRIEWSDVSAGWVLVPTGLEG